MQECEWWLTNVQRQKDPEERGSAAPAQRAPQQDCVEDGPDSDFEDSASEEDMPTTTLRQEARDRESQLPNCDSESDCFSVESGEGLHHDVDVFDASESAPRAAQQGLRFQPDVLRVNFDEPLQVSLAPSVSPPRMDAHAGRQGP